ncbi:OFA family MFS transporter [Halalkalibacter alkaliphilus]|uniref:OFA family MFS transporter n=1 Tax=Halalkalibacter alkaliphilus TaxID=2917993 RepID=A0A9X2CU39_9BACI|nr:OFA family MFS transporter [Halalkalibacter alkaliphilus]MCL7748287.1 OFA family MFS transporter [Halalkalibacter alkaliphilus]
MNRWFVVLGAVIIQINLGAVYAWSLFNQPLMNKFGWAREDVVVTFSITIATFALATIFAGRLQDKIGPRWVATIGGILLGLGLILASQATTLFQLYFFYGVIGGIGIGMTYVCPLSACVKWFPDKRGLISGVAVAGFGLGGLIFKPIIEWLIEGMGVSSTFLYLGFIYLTLVVAGAQLLKNPPVEEFTRPSSKAIPELSNHFSPKQMLGTYQFYLLWFMFLFGSMSGLMVISFAVDIGVDIVNLDIEKAANAVMVIALFNAAGRIVLGRVSDTLGRINTLMIIYGVTALIMFYMSTGMMNYTTFLLSVSLIGFCFGGFLALFPSVTADYYGTRNMGSNYGLMYQAYGISAFAGPIIVKAIPLTQAFLLSALFCVLALVMAKLVSIPKKKVVSEIVKQAS